MSSEVPNPKLTTAKPVRARPLRLQHHAAGRRPRFSAPIVSRLAPTVRISSVVVKGPRKRLQTAVRLDITETAPQALLRTLSREGTLVQSVSYDSRGSLIVALDRWDESKARGILAQIRTHLKN